MANVGVETWALFLRAHAAVVAVVERQVESRTGLPLSWYDVLLELDRVDELRMQDLADRVVLSRTRVSRLVQTIGQRGLLATRPDPNDGRATLVRITDAGAAELRRVAPTYMDAIAEHWTSALPAEALPYLTQALQAIVRRQDKG